MEEFDKKVCIFGTIWDFNVLNIVAYIFHGNTYFIIRYTIFNIVNIAF